ncbi:uncharacterized protein LOC113789825 [Dermatophagoides pteronyssinus]|uniref:uncharacterized protein LOC113789825 n=1 Tax=Dermatophagoides pteronyssinus TaxID=6956 RepID=UPI003F66C90A
MNREYRILTTRISINSQRQFLLKHGKFVARWLTKDEIVREYQDLTILNEFREKFQYGFSIISEENEIDPFENLIQVQSNRYKFFDVNEYIPGAVYCDCKDFQLMSCRTYGCENWKRGVECTAACPMEYDCMNRPLQSTSNEAYLEVFKTKQYNWGVKSRIGFFRNHFIAEYKGMIKSNNDETVSSVYSMDLGKTTVVDASSFCNAMRFLNHSCLPNSYSSLRAVDGQWRLGIYALRDICSHEEITIDYGKNYAQNPERCYCQAPNCAGIIGGKKEFEIEPKKWREPFDEMTRFLRDFFYEKLWETIPI